MTHNSLTRLAGFVTAALSLVAPVAARAGDVPTEVETRISRVTVYSDRALVTRTGTLAVQEGILSIVIPHLPARLEPGSLG